MHWPPAREAANIYRNLAEKNSNAFLQDLAMSLNNMGNSLDNLGQARKMLCGGAGGG